MSPSNLPGTVGFVIPDRFHLVYLEHGRAANALGLHESTGSRIAMATTAAGHAYTAALDAEVGDALLAEMEREMPDAAKLLRPRIEDNRQLPARARLCRRLRTVEPAHQRPRGAAVVAAIPDLCRGHDRPVVGDV